ncbi:MAG TPA: family 16 glycosylhydrolase [Gammaproteobacteria bacterium]|nr:family 16 glycosylhydrolase [Gammaproteobacteria bacterium]
MDRQDSAPSGRRTFIGLCLAALVLATLPGLAKAGDSGSATPMPFVTDGTMNSHGWVLNSTHSDEFSGQKLDTQKWVPDMAQWGTNWSWSPQNVSVSNGSLHLVLKYAPNDISGKHKAYTSGIIISRTPMRYGFFEARIKGAYPQPGVLPAFWLGGQGLILHDQRQVTEIDILEAMEHDVAPDQGVPIVNHMVHVFKHPNAPGLSRNSRPLWQFNIGGGPVSWNPFANYHVYGVEWTPRVIKMYVDGRLQGQIYNRWWHTPLVVMLSLGLVEPYQEAPSSDGFPSRMSVDYVRVWESQRVNALEPLWPQSRRVRTKQEWMSGLLQEHPLQLRPWKPRKRWRP